MKKIKDQQGIIIPYAVILLLLAGGLLYNMPSILSMATNSKITEDYTDLANREAENALTYGIWATNAREADGGHKCKWDKYLQTEYETTDEDGGMKTTFDGKKIKRFVTFKGTESDKDAVMTGTAKIYDDNGRLIAEKSVQMNMNLLYNGNNGDAKDPCHALSVKFDKSTFRDLKGDLVAKEIPPKPSVDTSKQGQPNYSNGVSFYGNGGYPVKHVASCTRDGTTLNCKMLNDGYITTLEGLHKRDGYTPHGYACMGETTDLRVYDETTMRYIGNNTVYPIKAGEKLTITSGFSVPYTFNELDSASDDDLKARYGATTLSVSEMRQKERVCSNIRQARDVYGYVNFIYPY